VITLAWALACTAGTTGDTGTPGTPPTAGPPDTPYVGVTEHSPDGVDHPIDWGCDFSGWTYDLYAVGVSASATLRMVETNRFNDPTDETHTLVVADTDPAGWWTHFHLELLLDQGNAWVDGATTNAVCEGEDIEALEDSWQLIITTTDGSDRADCAVWGNQPMWFEDSDCYIW